MALGLGWFTVSYIPGVTTEVVHIIGYTDQPVLGKVKNLIPRDLNLATQNYLLVL